MLQEQSTLWCHAETSGISCHILNAATVSDMAISCVHTHFSTYQTQMLLDIWLEIPVRYEEGTEGTWHKMDALENRNKLYLLLRGWLYAHIYTQSLLLHAIRTITLKKTVEEIKGECGTVM